SGVALDGRFGYQRPASFRPDGGFQILESALPLLWSSNWPNGFVSLDDGLKGAWNTGRQASEEYWGGYMDAGDWDRRVQHLAISDAFLDLWEHLPQEKRALDLGIPKSGEVLPLPGYAGLDGVSDLIHEAVWNIDFYRRLQMPDGRVRGGVESAGHPLPGTTSYLEHQPVYAYAPDVVSTYRYAASSARLSRILAELNLAELAGIYRASALAAWRAAEDGFSDPNKFYEEAIAASNEMDG
ncbi:glycoside hydrolase family 9 protein, partial [Arthrobacter sp. 08Y14]|uniref:glycoside hydrolase family 9 protein n=1 Tax=Arthrobacter sp. 08Y14 TaxID=2058885 RepID=UPI0015E2A866